MKFRCTGSLRLLVGLLFAGTGVAEAGEASVITVTQLACQFLEAENGIDHGFETTKPSDCFAINARTAESRMTTARVLRLKPGKYIFRVTNQDVPYALGFRLRQKDYDWRNPVHSVTKLTVSGGGVNTGQTRDYMVDLRPGEYIYSCPLNTTPDYRLVVEE